MPSSSWAVPLLAAGAVWIMLIRIGWLDIDGLLTFRGKDGRGDWIRTSDLHTPSVMRYQAALRPDMAGASRQGHNSRQGANGSPSGAAKAKRQMGKVGWAGAQRAARLARVVFGGGADRLAGSGQSRLERDRPRHDHLPRRQWSPCRHRHAGRRARPRLAPADPEARFRRA